MELVVVFNYDGMLRLVGDSYRKNGGKIEMLYTENDYDWKTENYMKNLSIAARSTKTASWHDMLLKLVSDSDIVVCARRVGLYEMEQAGWTRKSQTTDRNT